MVRDTIVRGKFTMLPSLALFITVFSLNLLGESLRARWSEQ